MWSTLLTWFSNCFWCTEIEEVARMRCSEGCVLVETNFKLISIYSNLGFCCQWYFSIVFFSVERIWPLRLTSCIIVTRRFVSSVIQWELSWLGMHHFSNWTTGSQSIKWVYGFWAQDQLQIDLCHAFKYLMLALFKHQKWKEKVKIGEYRKFGDLILKSMAFIKF